MYRICHSDFNRSICRIKEQMSRCCLHYLNSINSMLNVFVVGLARNFIIGLRPGMHIMAAYNTTVLFSPLIKAPGLIMFYANNLNNIMIISLFLYQQKVGESHKHHRLCKYEKFES